MAIQSLDASDATQVASGRRTLSIDHAEQPTAADSEKKRGYGIDRSPNRSGDSVYLAGDWLEDGLLSVLGWAFESSTFNWLVTFRTPCSMRTIAVAIRFAVELGTLPDKVNSPGLPTAILTFWNSGRLVNNFEKRASSEVWILPCDRDSNANAMR